MRVLKVIAGILIWIITIPFMLLAMLSCATIVGMAFGIPMFLFGGLLGAVGWRLISGKPVNFTAAKAERYAKIAAKRDARHNAGFAA